MNYIFFILSYITIFLFSGCSETGTNGNSYLTIGTSGIESSDNLDIMITFEDLDWDGEWDFILPEDTFADITTVPNQIISAGTYEYMVRVTQTGIDQNQDGEDDYHIVCSYNYTCPNGGVNGNPSLIIESNISGEDAPSLFEDGSSGKNRYYSFIVISSGLVSIVGGIASEINY